MATDVKQRMIEQMAVLLAAKGLRGASFSEVLKAAGAPRGSLYHYFPGGKDQLVIAALDLEAERVFAIVDGLSGQTAEDVARGFIGAWRGLLEGGARQIGCPLMAVTVATQSPPIRAKAGEIFRAWRGRLAEVLRKGGLAPGRAEALAAGLLAACEGAAVVARAEGSLTPFDLMADEQLAAIKAVRSR